MPLLGPKTGFLSDDEIVTVTNEMLRDARREVQLVSPWIGADHHTFERLLDCVDRGVKVTVFCRPPTEKDPNHLTAVEKLASLGVEVLEDPVLHAKMLIIDREEILVSSANLVHTSQVRNHEAGIGTVERQIVEDALSYLATLRKRIEAAAKRYCKGCGCEITIDPSKPYCLECWKSGRRS